MKPRRLGRGDWLFVVALFAAFVLVFWALFGAAIWKAAGW